VSYSRARWQQCMWASCRELQQSEKWHTNWSCRKFGPQRGCARKIILNIGSLVYSQKLFPQHGRYNLHFWNTLHLLNAPYVMMVTETTGCWLVNTALHEPGGHLIQNTWNTEIRLVTSINLELTVRPPLRIHYAVLWKFYLHWPHLFEDILSISGCILAFNCI
jgi:hypothetical protein